MNGPIPSSTPHLKVVGVKKSFGGIDALRSVDFEVKRGEIMALVGDNGAGKSTLMKILAGTYPRDSGDFYLDGKKVTINTPHDAAHLGLQIVYQDLALCENLDVSANLFLGQEEVVSGWTRFLPRMLQPLDHLKMEQKTQEAVRQLKIKTLKSISAKVGILSGGQRQAIAIARAIRAESSIILLDEPTAALGVAQTRQVLDVVKRLKENHHAVVYISHNLRDIFEICDRITVLRHGINVAIYQTSQTTADEVVLAMTQGVKKDHSHEA